MIGPWLELGTDWGHVFLMFYRRHVPRQNVLCQACENGERTT